MGLFDPAGSAAPSTGKPGGLFTPGAGGLFDPKKPKGADDLGARVAELEAQVGTSGAASFLDTGKGLGAGILDVLSRPNYAIAGAAEELLSPEGGGPVAALKRAGSEIFSGSWPGIKGEKRGFGEVMERAGVGKGPSFRLNLSPMDGDTEFSLRGTAGLLLDIGLDPTTYLGGAGVGKRIATAGGRRVLSEAGEKLFIAETEKALVAGAGKVSRPLAELAAESKITAAVNAGSRELVKDPGIYFAGRARLAPPVPLPFKASLEKIGDAIHARGSARRIAGYDEMVQAYSAGVSFQTSTMEKEIAQMAKRARLSPAAMRRVAEAIDEGTIASLQGTERQVADWAATRFHEIAQSEVDAGLLAPAKVRKNYFAHYYLDDPKQADRLIAQTTGQIPDIGNLGRNGEKRAFDYLHEAQTAGLQPLYDPFEALRRRWENSIEKRNLKDFVERAEVRFGIGMDPAEVAAAAMQASARPSRAMAQRAEAILQKGIKPGDAKGLSPQGRQYLYEQAISRAPDRASLMRLIVEHRDDIQKALPSFSGVPSQMIAADGSLIAKKTFAKSGLTATLPQSIFDDISKMDARLFNSNELNSVLRGVDVANNAFKGSVTAWFPAFHFRNAYSNIAQAFGDIGVQALSPALHGEAINIMLGANGKLTSKLGAEYSYAEVRKMMGELGVRASDRNLYEMADAGLRRDAIGKAGKLLDSVGKPARAFGGKIENEARGMLFTAYLKRGLTPEDAMARVNRVLFDYSGTALTSVEREGFKRLIPFYTWMRKNMELQVRQLGHHPGRLATEGKIFRGRESENQQMTSWERDALKVRLDRNGQTISVITGVDLPIRQLDLIWRGSLGKTGLGYLGMLSPLVKLPAETITGKNFFTGRDFGRTTSATAGRAVKHMPVAVQNWLGFDEGRDAAGRPKYTFDEYRLYVLAQAGLMSRLLSTSDRQFREYLNDEGAVGSLLDMATGLRLKEINLDEEEKKILRDRVGELEKALVRRGTHREFQRTYQENR